MAVKAYKNPDFLNSGHARFIRVMCEYEVRCLGVLRGPLTHLRCRVRHCTHPLSAVRWMYAVWPSCISLETSIFPFFPFPSRPMPLVLSCVIAVLVPG